MSLTTSEMTPADIRACTCGNDGYGNGDGMWGNGAFWLIVLLLFGWGRNGYGGHGGGYSRDDGKAYMMEQLEDMMEDAEKPAEKEALRRCMEALKRA